MRGRTARRHSDLLLRNVLRREGAAARCKARLGRARLHAVICAVSAGVVPPQQHVSGGGRPPLSLTYPTPLLLLLLLLSLPVPIKAFPSGGPKGVAHGTVERASICFSRD